MNDLLPAESPFFTSILKKFNLGSQSLVVHFLNCTCKFNIIYFVTQLECSYHGSECHCSQSECLLHMYVLFHVVHYCSIVVVLQAVEY